MSTRSARTFDGITYAPGARFRVTRPAKLSGMVADGPYSWRGWGQDLKPGDIITCAGFGAGFGSDPGYGVEFITPESKAAHAGPCEFRPSAGGMWAYRPPAGYLEPVSEQEG